MALVLGVGAPGVFADGPQETPGSGAGGRQECPPESQCSSDGPQETPGLSGAQETPGAAIMDAIITLATTFVA